MIILDAPLEQWAEKAIKAQSILLKNTGIDFVAYFLIGSFCSDGDIHVAHAAKCPIPDTATDKDGDSLSKLVDDQWIADNAEKIIRILPGGVHVVGIAWLSSRKVYAEQKDMLTRAIARIQRRSNSLTTLNLRTVSDSMALVFYETPNGKPQGVLIDVVGRSPDSATKVSYSTLEWVSVVTNASARVSLNVPTKDKQSHFYSEFVTAITPFTENLFGCQTVLLDGVIRDKNEPLFKDLKKKKKNSVELTIFVDPCFNRSNACLQQSATNLHELSFDIEIRAAVPARSKVEAAIDAAKEHLIRSLTVRAQLQHESMEIVEEAGVCPCSVHQMPRPATTVLHTQSAILLADYLFEADTVEDAQKNFEELVELKTNIEHVDEGWERILEADEMEAVRNPLGDGTVVSFRRDDDAGSILIVLLVLAVIVAVVAIVVYLVMAN